MCEYQRVEDNKPPVCEYTKDLCTFCVMGNCKTYKEATRSENNAKNT